MQNELAGLAEFLRRVALSYDARAIEAGTNERNRAAWMMAAEEARLHESFVRGLLSEKRSGWISHEEASSPDDGDDD